MELFLDSADMTEVAAAAEFGFLHGVTTTPTFMYRSGVKDVIVHTGIHFLSNVPSGPQPESCAVAALLQELGGPTNRRTVQSAMTKRQWPRATALRSNCWKPASSAHCRLALVLACRNAAHEGDGDAAPGVSARQAGTGVAGSSAAQMLAPSTNA